MSIPIVPSSPPSNPSVPITPSGGAPVSANFTPTYFFESTTSLSLPLPVGDASTPRLSLSEFYGSIANAKVGQKLQDFLNQLADPSFRKNLMKFAAEQAAYMTDVITLVYQYDLLSEQLTTLNLPDKANSINGALQAYNSTSDNSNITTLNSATSTYNTAQVSYQSALSSYQNALNTYEGAQTTYNSALTTWQNALSAYQAGTINQAQLQTARGVFDNAKNQFNSAKTTFDSAQTLFDNAKAVWQAAGATYSSAVTTYNTYAASRSGDLAGVNSAISNWNSTFGGASSIIAKMNTILSTLGLPPLTSTGALVAYSGLPQVTVPTGPSTLRNSVQADLDQDNALVGSINTNIAGVSGKVTIINAGGYNPPLTAPSTVATITTPLPATDSNTPAAILPLTSTLPASIVFTMPATIDLITVYLAPRLPILEELSSKTTTEQKFQEVQDKGEVPDQIIGKNSISAGIGTSAMGVSNAPGIGKSPFLGAILSKQAFEAIFNVYGIPAGSPLIDQLGALYTRVQANAGLASAGPASQILENAVLSGATGRNAVDASVALGNLSILSETAISDELKQAIASLISNDPSLAQLTPSQKNGLLEGVAGEIGASLNKSALNELARALGLPGLMPQILAKLAGIAANDPLASFSQQLYRYVLLAKELTTTFQISEGQASEIIQNALASLPPLETPTPAANSKATGQSAAISQAENDAAQEEVAVEKSIEDQLVKTGLIREDVATKLEKVSIRIDTAIQSELQKSTIAKESAFKTSLLKSFAKLELDPVKADLIAAQIPVGTVNNVKNLLIEKGLSPVEASQAASVAVNATNQKDPLQNPLSSFLIQQLGTTTEMAGLLKGQIVSILSPAVGMRTALDVAENYGSLIFSSANSVTNVLQVNERRLDAFSSFVYNARLFENYKDATKSYTSPELADDNPLKLGKTLLLSGIAGGLSNQGLTSSDNTVGPSANQSKHATSYPGIFG